MRDLPASDWLSNRNSFTPTNHARTTVSDPYASAADRQGFTSGWFASSMPDMNAKNPRVANYLIQNAIWWGERHQALVTTAPETLHPVGGGPLRGWTEAESKAFLATQGLPIPKSRLCSASNMAKAKGTPANASKKTAAKPMMAAVMWPLLCG